MESVPSSKEPDENNSEQGGQVGLERPNVTQAAHSNRSERSADEPLPEAAPATGIPSEREHLEEGLDEQAPTSEQEDRPSGLALVSDRAKSEADEQALGAALILTLFSLVQLYNKKSAPLELRDLSKYPSPERSEAEAQGVNAALGMKDHTKDSVWSTCKMDEDNSSDGEGMLSVSAIESGRDLQSAENSTEGAQAWRGPTPSNIDDALLSLVQEWSTRKTEPVSVLESRRGSLCEDNVSSASSKAGDVFFAVSPSQSEEELPAGETLIRSSSKMERVSVVESRRKRLRGDKVSSVSREAGAKGVGVFTMSPPESDEELPAGETLIMSTGKMGPVSVVESRRKRFCEDNVSSISSEAGDELSAGETSTEGAQASRRPSASHVEDALLSLAEEWSTCKMDEDNSSDGEGRFPVSAIESERELQSAENSTEGAQAWRGPTPSPVDDALLSWVKEWSTCKTEAVSVAGSRGESLSDNDSPVPCQADDRVFGASSIKRDVKLPASDTLREVANHQASLRETASEVLDTFLSLVPEWNEYTQIKDKRLRKGQMKDFKFHVDPVHNEFQMHAWKQINEFVEFYLKETSTISDLCDAHEEENIKFHEDDDWVKKLFNKRMWVLSNFLRVIRTWILMNFSKKGEAIVADMVMINTFWEDDVLPQAKEVLEDFSLLHEDHKQGEPANEEDHRKAREFCTIYVQAWITQKNMEKIYPHV